MSESLLHRLMALAALVLMLTLLGHPAVQRAQEARVLETAREMVGQPLHDWLIPHLNGQLRMEKPPLAYWLAAVAFQIGGVSEGVGRVPFALAGWGTLLLTWSIARRLFDARTAFYTAAVLLSGSMFARHARLAETDILAVFFVTAAVTCILRAENRLGWLALSGVMIGMAILAKGLPAIFAILFLIALVAVERDWRLLWRWTLSGAPILALLIGVPWFLYLKSAVGLQTIADEAEIGMRGAEHKANVMLYFPWFMQAVAPWVALTILALVLAIARWKTDRRLRMMLIWTAAIIVPLCFAGQKQFHYLFPAMPALAVLTGWLIGRTLERDLPQWELSRLLFSVTLVVVFIGCLIVPFVGQQMRGTTRPVDWIAATISVIGTGISLLALRHGLPRAMASFAISAAIVMTMLTQMWMPALRQSNPREVAASIQQVGRGPYYFYGENVSLPLVFHLKQVVPRLTTPEDLKQTIAQNPNLMVIALTKSGRTPPPVPEGLELATEIKADDQLFEVYRARPR